MMIIFLKVNDNRVEKYEGGTTKYFKKTPLILKGFFCQKLRGNDKSITWLIESCEDGLRF